MDIIRELEEEEERRDRGEQDWRAPENRYYQPYGVFVDFFRDKSLEILLEGPAGTGKTRAVLEKANLIACKYPGSRILFLRRWRASLNESVLVTFERDVLPANHYLLLEGKERRYRDAYRYRNGSTIVLGGLDTADRFMSAEYDMLCLFEATEAKEEEWEKAISRLRNHVVPYQQAVADCNPASPRHWLNIRGERMSRYRTRHTDNPRLYNPDGTPTPAGEQYLTVLQSLRGAVRKRLLEGVWAASTGLVYDQFSEKYIVRSVPGVLDCYAGVDYGTTNPTVFLALGVGYDGRLYVMDECRWDPIREGGRQRSDAEHVDAFRRWSAGLPVSPRWTFVDPSAASFIVALKRAGVRGIIRADNSILDGIRRVMSLFAGDRLFVHERCTGLIDELYGYCWDDSASERGEDRPMKTQDHGPDALRYIVNGIQSRIARLLRGDV